MKETTLITLLGPTAVGKTSLASRIAAAVGAEIISADSRQVFRGMDIGTGKDLGDYLVDGKPIPVYLVDIAEPGSEYSVFNFYRDFLNAREQILGSGKRPLLCGGTGLYLEAALLGYDMQEVPVNEALREYYRDYPDEALAEVLRGLKRLHNITDLETRERLLRAIEIAVYDRDHSNGRVGGKECNGPVIGLRFSRQENRHRISARLRERLRGGMVEEVEGLIRSGVPVDQLVRYGLEYRYVTQYLLGQLDYTSMAGLLETAIHQFAKRQMTWFRRMERKGIQIQWLEGEDGAEINLPKALEIIGNHIPG